MRRPRIVVTLSNPERARDPAVAGYKNARYLEALERHGARPLPLDDRVSASERHEAFSAADGLLMTGGTDIDPGYYGEPSKGSRASDPGRDALDAAAFRAARERGVPILGICRGMQAINIFCGGRVLQHVEHHESPAYPSRAREATRHRLQLVPGSRLRGLLGEAAELEVNSFHHQAVDLKRVAPGLRPSGLVKVDGVELVEALEAAGPGPWLFGVQCHPERVESSPPELARLWEAFVSAARANRRSTTA
jgi:putative glutamine amidotransferase